VPYREIALEYPYLSALLLTQLYLRGYYDRVYDQRPIGVLTMLVRQTIVATLAAISLRALGVARMSPERTLVVTNEGEAHVP
jgi:hypothetical protein